ncbi:PDR/VanB family oxidoreductase [Herbiconiux sp. SYSU D00978]|uniref:PDR/VanB family oxidoreductase n=1 Tax=Herbiconiux sp. SYSU D00978 TaxID=2812562 RepID=UPI001A95A02B|nr:PDR/VanB family oxidoreductase [Herbiconiux sp. SYSU D00978]
MPPLYPEYDVVVTDRTLVADEVAMLDLADARGNPLPGWLPGAHLDVLLPGGEERQYSLCGDPDDRSSWRIAVLREPAGRGGSLLLHTVAVGDRLRVRGPQNHFAFAPTAGRSYLFLAGGIGITPLLPMLRAADAAGCDFRLVYAGRSRSSMAFAAALAESYGDRVRLHPSDEGARVDLALLLGELPLDTQVYCCGPTRLLDAVENLMADRLRDLHMERFEARALTEPVLDEPFEVELAMTGVTVTVPPSRSILDVAEEAGALVLSSCREGTCGTCETPILEGEADHRDSILTPDEQEENRMMYICVSRAACPRLVLEL